MVTTTFGIQIPFVKVGRARDSSGNGEHWALQQVSPTINLFDLGDTRSVVAILGIIYEHSSN